MMNDNTETYIKYIIDILNAYEQKQPLMSCQGQAMDGYSALANFLDVARKLRENESIAIK